MLSGSLVNVTVAWTGAILNPQDPTRPSLPIRFDPIAAGSTWPLEVDATWPAPNLKATKQTFVTSAEFWIAIGEMDPVAPQGVYALVIYRAGWPMRAVRCAFHSRDSGRPNGSWLDSVSTQHAIPLRPIWLGFLINCAFYAAVLWLVVCAPPLLRRTLRRNSGLCISCGYDLRGNTSHFCPECGGRLDQLPHVRTAHFGGCRGGRGRREA